MSAAALAIGACSHKDSAPPLATPTFTASKVKVTLGSPIEFTYKFDVAPNAKFPGDYRVLMHVLDADGQLMWTDDHDPMPPTSQWKPGQTVQYTRTRFVPVFPYVGEATVRIGLYKDNDRLPLLGAEPVERTYKVGTLQLLPASENVFIMYKTGWHSAESAPGDATVEWQWTEKQAIASFKNPKRDVVLYLDYDARPDLFDKPQMLTLLSGDQVVTSFAADSNVKSLRRIPITAAQLGTGDMSELRIQVDRTFVPAKLPTGGTDTRELGIRIYHLFVEPVSAAK